MAIMAGDNVYWLGKVPDDWGISRIGDYYKLRNEKVSDRVFPPLSVTMKGIVPQLATAAKTDDHDNRKLVRKGDFAINSRSDRRGSCGISDYDGSVSLINTVLTPRGEMNPRYYDWLFHTEQFADEFYKWGHGIVDDLWTTRWQEMKSILIVSPPLAEQQAIASYLDDRCSKLDEIITEAEKSIEEYKVLKQAVIFEAVTKGLDKNVPMKDSGIRSVGDIPAHWFINKMSRICNVITDYVASGSFASLAENVTYLDYPDYALLVRTADISGKSHAMKRVYVSKESYDFLHNSNLFGGEIILPNIGASVGDVYMVPKLYEHMTLAPNAVMLRTNQIDDYYYYFFKCDAGRALLIDIAQSTAQAKFNKTELRQLRLPQPPKEEQEQIVSYLTPLVKEIDSLIDEKQVLMVDLQTYKKSLIYEVVTGKKRVVV